MSAAIIKRGKLKIDVLNGKVKNIVRQLKTEEDEDEDDISLQQILEELQNIEAQHKDAANDIINNINSMEELISLKQQIFSFDDDIRYCQIETKRRIKKLAPMPVQHQLERKMEEAFRPATVKLPAIALPTFKGKHEDWKFFKENFEQLILFNETLSSFQKLFYLKSALKEDASKLQSPNDTLESLWDALRKRYENKRIIIEKQVTGLFTIKPINRECSSELRSLIDTVTQHIRVLKSMEMDLNPMSEMMIINIVSNRIDAETRKQFEITLKPQKLPTWNEMLTFLENRCYALENIEKTKSEVSKNISRPTTGHTKLTNRPNALLSDNVNVCPMCQKDHYINQCDKFLSRPTKERWDAVKKLKLCFNCMGDTHTTKMCKRGVCKKCSAKHHTLLHNDFCKPNNDSELVKNPTNENKPKFVPRDVEPVAGSSQSSCSATSHDVLLSAIVLKIYDEHDQPIYCRAILDSGAQSNFVTEKLAQMIKSKRTSVNIPVFGINQKSTVIRSKIYAKIQSRTTNYNSVLQFLVLPKITGYHPNSIVPANLWTVPNDIDFADPNFRTPQSVDMLLGVEVFNDVWMNNQIKIGANLPVLYETQFGWIVSGKYDMTKHSLNSGQFCGLTTKDDNLMEEIKRFWEIESCHGTTMSIEEKEVERHFIDTHKRQDDGRYIIKLPTKPNVVELGDSQQMAIKRFDALERKLSKNEELNKQYHKFMQEYIDLGHMTLTTNPRDIDYFLPHHGVLKPSSSTTKLRVVFDASATTTTGLSLNDVLKVGPTIQQQLFEILLRFRKHRYAFSADIGKMYRQVLIDDEQRNFQQILWRNKSDEMIQQYSLNTVTYGMASAPYLATRTLQQLADDERNTYPLASAITKTDFYVDDVLSGAETPEKACELQKQLIEMLSRGGFQLHKWCANHPNLLKHINPNDCEKKVVVGESETIKTLGLTWQPNNDLFVFAIEQMLLGDRAVTKRNILSDIARLYDPLGLTGPIILAAKLMMQSLWQKNLDWDQPLDETDHDEWVQFKTKLKNMPDVQIPRCILPALPCKSIYLLGFCDASTKAYGACVYLHCVDTEGNRMTTLLCSKSKVAPLKALTIPRLELCSAVLLAQLTHKVEKAMAISFDKRILYSDSTVALGWINSKSSDAKTFVSHRIAEIQDLTKPSEWRHISTHDNPADVISRGLMPTELHQSKLWWHGPDFLNTNEENWLFETTPNNNLPEMKPSILITNESTKSKWEFLEHFEQISQFQRIMAYVLRFISNCKKKTKSERRGHPISATEISNGLTSIVRAVQLQEFAVEYKALQNGGIISKRSPLFRLNVFMDDKGLLRVGGRIRNSDQNYDVKFQLLLPKGHLFTKHLIRSLHVYHGHAGQRTLLSIVRQRYWPIDAKNIIRNITRSCVQCFRCNPQSTEQMMGDLPNYRTIVCHPFLNSGVDYAGPFHLKLTRNTQVKAYAAIFVCLSTKAIHIELVSELSTKAFIAALTRFISRRGHCKNIYSDNGTNFVGAKADLQPLFDFLKIDKAQQQIQSNCSDRLIEFHFIPPRAPHFGGIWEAAVKQMKYHLVRIVGTVPLNFEELTTVLSKVEAILNSRPLFAESTDPEDVNAITPGHFLIGRPLVALVEPDYQDVQSNRINRWQLLQQMTQHFWKIWSTQYLTAMQVRTQSKCTTNIKEGMLVLLKEDNQPPMHWLMGRIIQIHPGADKIVRVVTVKTQQGTIMKRAVVKICILPQDQE